MNGSCATRTRVRLSNAVARAKSFRTVPLSPQSWPPVTMAPVPDQSSSRPIPRFDSSSPHGHDIGSSCEASGLLSPDHVPRTFPAQERDGTAIMDHVEDQDETHPSPSPSPAPLNPSSIRKAKDAQPTPFRRATHWKTVGMIIGFLVAGQSTHA
jgi:hypothetical protein